MDDDYPSYVAICWAFAASFLVVLVWLAVAPSTLVDLLNWQGRLFGFDGEVRLGAADLDHVLSLSLMACVVTLAVQSARHPESRQTFAALLVAKIVSTVGFGALLVLQGGVWLVPALADGSVAAGLFVARSLDEGEGGQTRAGELSG